jgi:hypothetical protein
MLASMVEIDNLDGVRKVFGDKIPDPFGAIADDHLLLHTAPTAFPRFSIDAFAKLHRGFDGPGVGGAIRVADRVAFPVPGSLGEHTSRLGLPRMSR